MWGIRQFCFAIMILLLNTLFSNLSILIFEAFKAGIRTTQCPNVFANNIIPSILIYPVPSNIHLDILIVPLYAYE